MSMTPDNPSDRRRAPRIPCKIEADVSHGVEATKGKLLDLTIYGAFLSTPTLSAHATLVRLTFRVSSDREIAVKGRIAWKRPGEGAGVEFLDMKPENVRGIQEYLANLD